MVVWGRGAETESKQPTTGDLLTRVQEKLPKRSVSLAYLAEPISWPSTSRCSSPPGSACLSFTNAHLPLHSRLPASHYVPGISTHRSLLTQGSHIFILRSMLKTGVFFYLSWNIFNSSILSSSYRDSDSFLLNNLISSFLLQSSNKQTIQDFSGGPVAESIFQCGRGRFSS